MAKPLTEMTLDELNAESDRLTRERHALKDRHRAVAAARRTLLADANLMAKLGRMKPEEKRRIVLKPGVADSSAK